MTKLTKITKKTCVFAVFCAFLSFFCTFFNICMVFSDSTKYYFTSNIEHLFTHCLIAYPELAFSKNNPMSKSYKIDCITAQEFKLILDELHKNNYALVDINSCFDVLENCQAIKRKVKIPIGKKPLILSFDDVNYDSKKIGLGMVDKIIIDESGNLASYTKINNKVHISHTNEFIPILESFVKKHPDFSINGAKGLINLTGYDGILGYRTSHTNVIDRKNEIAEAKKVVNKLKQNGWQFASHSYGHYHMNKITEQKFESEINLWKQEVETIVGKTNIYVYPYGEWQVFDNGSICNKHKMLKDAGFALFCGVGMRTFFNYLPNNNHKVLFMDRKCVDGRTLTANHRELQSFFNPLQVIDNMRTK